VELYDRQSWPDGSVMPCALDRRGRVAAPRRDQTGDPDPAGDRGLIVAACDDSLAYVTPDILRRRWRSVFGRPAPTGLSRPLMIRILRWREQINRLGDIDARTRAALAAARNTDESVEGSSARTRSDPGPRPGSVLVREHAGVLHRVMVLDKGYAWNGRSFASLSAAAFAITGTKWNGRRFFGLDRPPTPKKVDATVGRTAPRRTDPPA
jgi:hypothetical protein